MEQRDDAHMGTIQQMHDRCVRSDMQLGIIGVLLSSTVSETSHPAHHVSDDGDSKVFGRNNATLHRGINARDQRESPG